MNSILRVEWEDRLESAELNPSWRSRLEAKVLRFLLRRYAGLTEEAPIPVRQFYRGETPHGRAKMALSTEQQRERLGHLAAVRREAEPEVQQLSSFDLWAQEAEYRQRQRHQRWLTRKERGYW
jgi:hypothetical protein